MISQTSSILTSIWPLNSTFSEYCLILSSSFQQQSSTALGHPHNVSSDDCLHKAYCFQCNNLFQFMLHAFAKKKKNLSKMKICWILESFSQQAFTELLLWTRNCARGWYRKKNQKIMASKGFRFLRSYSLAKNLSGCSSNSWATLVCSLPAPSNFPSPQVPAALSKPPPATRALVYAETPCLYSWRLPECSEKQKERKVSVKKCGPEKTESRPQSTACIWEASWESCTKQGMLRRRAGITKRSGLCTVLLEQKLGKGITLWIWMIG